jgi:hypothetical protein
MKLLYCTLTCFAMCIAYGQPPAAEVSRNGIAPITTSIPTLLPERFISITKSWAQAFTRPKGGYDASNVSSNTITISAFEKNGFSYQNTGERIDNKIRYSLVITFTPNSYTVQFVVDDIYGDNNIALTYKLADYYKPDGSLKDGYEGLETSLEATINDIVQSHYSYIVNYK